MNTPQWDKVFRSLDEARKRLIDASTEEQYQSIGVICRETLISLAQSVYNPDKHLTNDGVSPSDTDAKRMLDAYLSFALQGKSNKNIRRLAKATIDLANELQHKRTADCLSAALCIEATNSVVNIISLISGHDQKINPPDIAVSFSYAGQTMSQDEHLYLLQVVITNTGGRSIKEFKLEFTFPNLDTIPLKWYAPNDLEKAGKKLLEIEPKSDSVSIAEDGYFIKVSYHSKNTIFPRETKDLSHSIGLRYRINHRIFANHDNLPPLKWVLYADDLQPKQGQILIRQLNEF